MRHLVIAMAVARGLVAGEQSDGAAEAVPWRERHVCASAVHVARRLEYSRGAYPRVGAGVGRASADARAHAARRQRIRRPHAFRLHRLEGVLREPARIFRDGEFVSTDWRRSVSGDPFAAWTLGVRPAGKLRDRIGSGRAINLARQGFVVFTYDMIGYNDSRQLEHRTFGGPREKLWGLSMAGLQLWNGIRALDFLESLPYVQRDAIGATGASGGGTQVFLLAAVDERVAVAAPVNMISLHMQGGCLCENQPGLRLETNNVEIAATIAPRPLLMVSATGDWTTNTMEREYPAVRALYALHGAADRVHAVRFEAPHNYNRESREAVYAWMARWLQNAPADVRREERAFTPDPLPDLLVFHQRARSAERGRRGAVDDELDRRCPAAVVVDAARGARARAAPRARFWAAAPVSARAAAAGVATSRRRQ